MTVDQRGENVLFVVGDGFVEAHVQIRYQGDPERFAWLVPMPVEPEVSVGSQPLFDALLRGSRPVFGLRTRVMRCDGSVEESEAQGCAAQDASLAQPAGASMLEESETQADPIGETVGAFDVTTLKDMETDEILQWLQDNDFELPPRTAELIDPYVRDGAVFVALRLTPGAGVQEIHPIVFRYPGDRPAIPVQLTAVAAVSDMRIRTFFLGEGRMAPTNFRHVELNQVRLHWPSFASNYDAVLSRAVDETGDGLGFVTEYAGDSAVVDPSAVHSAGWDAAAFEALEAAEVVPELERQGLADCSSGSCRFTHPLVAALLQRHLPAPAGLDERRYWACVECEDEESGAGFDARAFADDFDARVVAPGRHAAGLLESRPYLTRMVTMISPDEMRVDPAFHERADLPAVARERWAERTVPCQGRATLRLPDGRVLQERSVFSAWPGSDSGLPDAERIALVPRRGALEVVVDASAEIDLRVEALNAETQRSADTDSAAGGRGALGGCRIHPGLSAQAPWLGLAVLALIGRRRRLRA
ncbi:MAG: DUF2330 domain-containing protein [Myxococcales bacterium]|jgi:hypothetical protein